MGQPTYKTSNYNLVIMKLFLYLYLNCNHEVYFIFVPIQFSLLKAIYILPLEI